MKKLFLLLIPCIFLFSCTNGNELFSIGVSVELPVINRGYSNAYLVATLNEPFIVTYKDIINDTPIYENEIEITFTDDTMFELLSADYINQTFTVQPLITGIGKVQIYNNKHYYSSLPIHIN